MISYLQAVVIGLLQGATELFPVSSLGHSVLVPALLGWNSGALTTDRLSELGRQVGVTSPQFQQKVRDGTYDNWVRQVTDQSSQRGVVQTPTVLVNGRQADTALTAQGLLAAVNAASSGQ